LVGIFKSCLALDKQMTCISTAIDEMILYCLVFGFHSTFFLQSLNAEALPSASHFCANGFLLQ